MENIQAKIKSFLANYMRSYALGDDEDIFATGLVTSLFAMELVTFVETEFAVTIENEDLDIDNFRTVQALTSTVQRKLDQLQG